MEDKKEQHLNEVWIHELQDHANLIATLTPDNDTERVRNAYYEGFALGLNEDESWIRKVVQQLEYEMGTLLRVHEFERIRGKALETTLMVATYANRQLGWQAGFNFANNLRKEDRQVYRQKAYDRVKQRMSKITPWSDQTKKPL